MGKKVLFLIRKICFGFLILYGFNFLVGALDIFIPINIVTISAVGALGFPGLFSLVTIFFLTK